MTLAGPLVIALIGLAWHAPADEPVEPEPPAVEPGEPAAHDEESEPVADEAPPEPEQADPAPEPEASETEVEAAASPAATAVDTSDAVEAPKKEPETEDTEDAKKKGPVFEPGVQAFLRGEGRLNPDFDSSDGTAPDRGQVLQRIRLQARAIWGPVAAFAQVQDTRTWGFETSTVSNEGNTDLHQGYLELFGGKKNKDASGYIRLGRQEILYGGQRMIGPLLWMPNARSFNAVRLHGEASRFKLDMFGALLAIQGTATDTSTDPPTTANTSGAQLVGGTFGVDVHEAFNGELIALGIRQDARDEALDFDRRVGDVGARLWGKPVDGLRYDAEGHFQVGRFNRRDHLAWAWAGMVEYIYGKKRVKPGAHVGYAMASGESCVTDPDPALGNPCGGAESTEFFNFFPTNHIYYGMVDLLGWRNMRDFEVAAKLGFDKLLKSSIVYHYFQLQEPDGRWTNAGGAEVGGRWDPTNTRNDLGHEIDFLVTLKPWKPLMIQSGYGVFIPVGAGRSLGGDDPQHFIYLWLVATFP